MALAFCLFAPNMNMIACYNKYPCLVLPHQIDEPCAFLCVLGVGSDVCTNLNAQSQLFKYVVCEIIETVQGILQTHTHTHTKSTGHIFAIIFVKILNKSYYIL